MSRGVWIDSDPFANTSSGTTSDVLDLRDAERWSLSARTSAGTTSTYTLQISNATGTLTETGNIAESTWSTAFSEAPATTDLHDSLPVPVRWARVLRDDSVASFQFRVHKLVR